MYYNYDSPLKNWIVLRTESDFTSDGGIRKTEFEHLIDHAIRLKDTTSCMIVDITNAIAFAPCFEDIESWTNNEGTNQIISDKHMQCLTVIQVPVGSTFYLALQQCGDNKKWQKWIFQTDNKNPDIIENNQEISINDMEEWRIDKNQRSHHYNKFCNIWWTFNVNRGKWNIV